MRKVAAFVAVLALGVTGAAFAHGGDAPSIKLESARAVGHTIVVHVQIEHWKMLPSRVGKKPNSPTGGHWHVFVDGKYNNFSANATTGKALKVTAGWHIVQAELANNDHSELKPPVKSRTMRVHVG
ncbi:MAG TPA: hypothetical protein VI408_15275 [Gaiellaceae bacterium]